MPSEVSHYPHKILSLGSINSRCKSYWGCDDALNNAEVRFQFFMRLSMLAGKFEI